LQRFDGKWSSCDCVHKQFAKVERCSVSCLAYVDMADAAARTVFMARLGMEKCSLAYVG
jgi:hypothetical protein